MTETLRYRFTIGYTDEAGDHDTSMEYAETPEVALAQFNARSTCYSSQLYRNIEVYPEWDAVLYPNGEIVQRRFHEEAQGDVQAALRLSDIFEQALSGSLGVKREAAE